MKSGATNREVLILEVQEVNYPKITVITVSYNCVSTIEQTIQSVVGQTYPHMEYIIIDGGSTDGTVDIIKRYHDKIDFWSSEPDDGIYDAMNKGVKQAHGNYVLFLGSDDCLVSSEIMAQVAQSLNSTEQIDILSAPVWAVDEQLCLQNLFENYLDDSRIDDGRIIPHQGMLTKRELLQRMPFDTTYRIAGDQDFLLKSYFDSSVRFKYVDFPIAFYSTGGVSSSAFTNTIRERLQLMIKYRLNQRSIIKTQKRLQLHRSLVRNVRFRLQYWVRALLKPIYTNYYFCKRLLPGWQRHSCEWPGCRWCKKLEG